MIDFKESRERCFAFISKTEEVILLNEAAKTAAGFTKLQEVWEINTEIVDPNFKVLMVRLNVLLNPDFPLSFPNIYVNNEDYSRIKYIPHVDENRLICTFDIETSRTVPEHPGELLYHCLYRSKKILEDGLKGLNNDDYLEEFLAYWEQNYGRYDKCNTKVLYLSAEKGNFKEMKVLYPKVIVQGYEYVLHFNDDQVERFRNYLKLSEIKFEEHDVFYVADFRLSQSPPFSLTYNGLIERLRLMGGDELKDFKRFVNSGPPVKLLVFQKVTEGHDYLLGYRIELPLFNNKNRYYKYSNYEKLKAVNSNINVQRLSPQIFTKQRLTIRSAGLPTAEQYKFVLVGCGSIGSNLFGFLQTLDSPEFRLIDADDLLLENIGRHYLGFAYTGQRKTLAMSEYYLKQNPLNSIQTREDSIIAVMEREIAYLNESDFIFVAIGKYNIETTIRENIKRGLIRKPVFFLWVEPYLVAGHCVFIHPDQSEINYFDENGLFKFNVISADDYMNPELNISLNEGGCQTSYIPYSNMNVQMFLAALFPLLVKILKSDEKKTKAFTWIGSIDILREINLKPSLLGLSVKEFDLVIHDNAG